MNQRNAYSVFGSICRKMEDGSLTENHLVWWLDQDREKREELILGQTTDLFDPHKFFVIRSGLWFSENFCEQILAVAKKTTKLPLIQGSFNLPKPMNDAEIRESLGDGHLFVASEFCAVLAGMVVQQPKGEDGKLLANGKANIFYVLGKNDEVFAVYALWSSDDSGWRVRAPRTDGIRWPAGFHAFSRNRLLGK